MQYRAKDIAAMLGLSTATVSFVLNGKEGVREDTRKVVLNKVKELGCEYLIKSPIAVSVARSSVVGFVIYKRTGEIVNESPFFVHALEGINAAASKHGYSIVLIHIDKSLDDEEKLAVLLSYDCAGYIVFAVEMLEDDVAFLEKTQIPFILFDNHFPELDIDSVSINNRQGIHKAVQFLVDMGHKKIGYLRSKVPITSFLDRFTQYKAELNLYDLEFNSDYIIDLGYSTKDVQDDIDSFLQKNHPLPTAFLADNDLIACNAILAFKSNGFDIPRDISIIGFDDRPICTVISPQLTTISVPKDLFGSVLVENLHARIRQKRSLSIAIEIGTELIVRDSVYNCKVLNNSPV